MKVEEEKPVTEEGAAAESEESKTVTEVKQDSDNKTENSDTKDATDKKS